MPSLKYVWFCPVTTLFILWMCRQPKGKFFSKPSDFLWVIGFIIFFANLPLSFALLVVVLLIDAFPLTGIVLGIRLLGAIGRGLQKARINQKCRSYAKQQAKLPPPPRQKTEAEKDLEDLRYKEQIAQSITDPDARDMANAILEAQRRKALAQMMKRP